MIGCVTQMGDVDEASVRKGARVEARSAIAVRAVSANCRRVHRGPHCCSITTERWRHSILSATRHIRIRELTLLLQEIVRNGRTRVVVISGRDASEVLPLLNIHPRSGSLGNPWAAAPEDGREYGDAATRTNERWMVCRMPIAGSATSSCARRGIQSGKHRRSLARAERKATQRTFGLASCWVGGR